MRIRKHPEARPALAAWPCYVDRPESLRGRWADAFPRRRPMELELGCGKGAFIAAMGVAHPERNFVALDLISEMLYRAMNRVREAYAERHQLVDNLLMASVDIERILSVMDGRDRFSAIYVNFCPPWAKARGRKHRLTAPRQLLQYRRLLAPDGRFYLKTDDAGLFESALVSLEECGYAVEYRTRDLRREGAPVVLPETEHEKMFSDAGLPIRFCMAVGKDLPDARPESADERSFR